LRLDAGERGTINGKVRAERVGNDARRWPIRGELRAATAELGFITLYAPEIDRAAGRFNADLVIDGVATAPQVSGVMRLDGGQLDFYQVNLALRDLAIEARLLSNNLSFTGRGKAGDGKLDTEGDLQWRDGLPYGKVSFKGDKLRVVNVPEARIDASPNLEFRVDGRRIMAVGEVVLPYARIAPAELTGAVLSSSDEIIVGARLPDPSKRFEVASQIKMTLGDDVTVDTAGLSGSLTGSITVRTTADDVSRALGELVVDEGKYTAYGRKLDIQRGRLIFSGGLLGDPAVDIRAVKQFPDVVAGINVRGSLRQPRLTYFSEPALPQSQIVSLILAGGTLESAQASNRQGSPGARNEFLAQGGAILAQQLGQRVGLEDVSIESNLANETSLVLGKYLSPRLYVSYGISLTESINTIKMRYTINDKWTVKTEAGKERSADLVYTIEK
jgi:translocation and assembly module TamB